MFGKLGLVVLIVLFGVCMFVAGAMAPVGWRSSIASFGGSALRTHPDAPINAALAASSKPAPAASTPADAPAPASTMTVKLDSLLVSAAVQPPAPAKGQPAYALQLGQFARSADADAAMRRGAGAAPDLPLARIATVAADNTPWTVVAIGRYVSPAMAQRDAARLCAALGLRDLPVIRLPEAVPPEASPSAKPGA